jgi:phosphate transport system substrate-binding protein
METIQDGSYKPLSRPLFMYPASKSLKRPEVKAFMDFVVANQQAIAEAAQIVPLTSDQAGKAQQEIKDAEAAAGA